MNSGYVFIHNNVFPTLLAISHEEQSLGLMYQDWPPPVMSFVYSSPQYNKFWMKNTPSPLDIIFCCNGEVKQIHKGEPYSTFTIGDVESDLVIELPFGTAESSGIRIGHKVGIVRPNADELKKIMSQNDRYLSKF